MKVIIKETGEAKYLTILDKNGIDFARDLSADDDNIKYNSEIEEYETDQATFEWWETVINNEKELQEMIEQIEEFYRNENHVELSDKICRICGDAAEDRETSALRQMDALREAFPEATKQAE